jgi:hypothetical protein
MPRNSSTVKESPVIDNPRENMTKAELRQEALNGVLQVGQLAALTFGQFSDAGAIGMHGPKLVSEVVSLAENNSKVASKVDLLIEIGPYAGIVAAAIPFLAQLFVNHGVVKAELFANAGVVPPDQLEQRMKLTLMQQAMEVQRQQMEMEREMQEARAEYDAAMNGHASTNDI